MSLFTWASSRPWPLVDIGNAQPTGHIDLTETQHRTSVFGQKRTFAVPHACPLYPRKLTCPPQPGMSALCQKADIHELICKKDHLCDVLNIEIGRL